MSQDEMIEAAMPFACLVFRLGNPDGNNPVGTATRLYPDAGRWLAAYDARKAKGGAHG